MANLLKAVFIGALSGCILFSCNSCFANIEDSLDEQDRYTNGTCGSDELNHSILVECNSASSCRSSAQSKKDDGTATVWPKNSDEVLHIQSSHSGQRLVQTTMKQLNHIVDDHMKMFDINTTLTLEKKMIPPNRIGIREILGLGGTLELKRLALAIDNNSFERVFGPIFDIMFGTFNSGAHLNLLRLTFERNLIREHDLGKILKELDKQVARSRNNALNQAKLKIILDLMKLPTSGDKDLAALSLILADSKQHLANVEIWALAIDGEDLRGMSVSMKPRVDCHLFATILLEEAPDFVDWLKLEGVGHDVKGLLVKFQYSTAYNSLRYLDESGLIILTVGRTKPMTKYFGDWHNAQEYAVEMLNHFKFGSSGFIENVSAIELDSPESLTSSTDASIYSLTSSHNTLFKGPMFYATCHFSRYVSASRPINYKLYTQPNMFSAHYLALVTNDDQYFVLIVSNGNEHLLPFSWVSDDKLVAHIGLEPRSFNTFVMKIK